MKIALLGYGRQGKKYAGFFKKQGRYIDIFSRSSTSSTLPISRFSPVIYSIIIVAISPISEQENEIRHILDAGFEGFLIIEKPVVQSMSLLEKLVYRKKTIFMIDECFLGVSNIDDALMNMDSIVITLFSQGNDYINILEHACGVLLTNKHFKNMIDMLHIYMTHHEDLAYTIHIDNEKFLQFQNTKLFYKGKEIIYHFDYCFLQLLRVLTDEKLLGQIRENYSYLRKSVHYR